MKEQLKYYLNGKHVVLLPHYDFDIKNSLEQILGCVMTIYEEDDDVEIINTINNSHIEKIYIVGNNNFYRFLLPRLKKRIQVCWIFKNSFSSLSDSNVRYTLQTIMEFYDRGLVNLIGCIDINNYKVLENVGYNCEFLEYNNTHANISNTIGILSNDYDPNNNFYNQLAALTFVDYDYCKIRCVMDATKKFCDFFKIKNKKMDNFDEILKDNFVNLYINFTNTNKELIKKSFEQGVPCIVGNTYIFDSNKYLKEHLVIKSDDDINEIVEKIEFVRLNREKIMLEYNKMI